MPTNTPEYRRAHYVKNRDRILAQRKEFRAANLDRVSQANADCRRRYHERYRIRKMMRLYGLTEAEVLAFDQIKVCAICNGPGEVIDHDHETSKARGKLCHRCNRGIGMFFDSPELLQKVIDYLKGFGK